jgi:hypothetical protein
VSTRTAFTQSLGSDKRTVEVGPDRVHFTSEADRFLVRDGLDVMKFSVRFEELLDEPIEFPLSSELSPVPMYILGGLGGLCAFAVADSIAANQDWAPLAILCSMFVAAAALYGFFLRVPRCTMYQLSVSDPPLLLAKQFPSEDEVATFLGVLMAARNEYLRMTYATDMLQIDKISRLERLAALLEAGALSQSEFAKLKEEVLTSDPSRSAGLERAGNYL